MPGGSDRLLVAASEFLFAGAILTLGISIANWIVLGSASTVGANAANLESVYALAILAGALIVVSAVGVWAVHHPTSLGVGTVVLSVLTFYAGLDFVPAIVLTVTGGLLAILHDRLTDMPERGIPVELASRPPPDL